MPKYSGQNIEPEEIFRHATNCEHACAALQHEINDHFLAATERPPKSMVIKSALPMGILSAFTVELYLKCLLRIDLQQFPVAHAHRPMFDLLEEARRDEVKAKFNHFINTDEQFVFYQQQWARAGYTAEFYSMLDQGSTNFVDWRYFFENPVLKHSGVVTFPNPIAVAIREVILDIHPEWREHVTTLTVMRGPAKVSE